MCQWKIKNIEKNLFKKIYNEFYKIIKKIIYDEKSNWNKIKE